MSSAQGIHSDSITLSGTVLNDASTPLKPNVRFSTFNQDDPPVFVNINADNLRSLSFSQPYEWGMTINSDGGNLFVSRQNGNLLNTNMSINSYEYTFDRNKYNNNQD